MTGPGRPATQPAHGYAPTPIPRPERLVVEGLDDDGRPLGRYDLSGLPGPLALRARLADAFAAQAGYGGSWNSPSTCKTSFYVIKAFCDFLATIDPPLAGFEELRGGHWNDFQLFLRTERNQSPEALGGTLTIVRTLLSRIEEIPAATRDHIDRWWRTPQDEEARELRVLTAAEFDRVRTAARRHALLARRRILDGWALLEGWRRDPSALTVADRRLADALDHLARYGDVRRTPKAYVLGPGWAPVHLRHSTVARVGGVPKVTAMLFPNKADLVALSVLFVCEAGFNRSVIDTLPGGHRRPDSAVGDTEVRTVATDKPRRGARRHSTHSFVDGVDVDALSAYRLALDITAGAHHVLGRLGHPTDRLLVHWSGKRNDAGLHLQVGLPLAEYEIVWAEDVGLRTDPDDDGEILALRATLPELRRSFQVLGRRPAQNTLRTHVRSYLARSGVAAMRPATPSPTGSPTPWPPLGPSPWRGSSLKPTSTRPSPTRPLLPGGSGSAWPPWNGSCPDGLTPCWPAAPTSTTARTPPPGRRARRRSWPAWPAPTRWPPPDTSQSRSPSTTPSPRSPPPSTSPPGQPATPPTWPASATSSPATPPRPNATTPVAS